MTCIALENRQGIFEQINKHEMRNLRSIYTLALVLAWMAPSADASAQLQDPFSVLTENSLTEPPDEVEGPDLGQGFGGEVPVDGGLSLLLAAGTVLGYRRMRKNMG